VIRYDEHAKDRMEERGVTEEDVRQALNRRTHETPGPLGKIWIWGYATGGRRLKVGVRADDKELVITVAWPDQ
jgi:hypothetical protein